MPRVLEAFQLAPYVLPLHETGVPPRQLSVQFPNAGSGRVECLLRFSQVALEFGSACSVVNYLQQCLLVLPGERGDLSLAENANRKTAAGDPLYR